MIASTLARSGWPGTLIPWATSMEKRRPIVAGVITIIDREKSGVLVDASPSPRREEGLAAVMLRHAGREGGHVLVGLTGHPGSRDQRCSASS
ncbi:hypothetical protein [Deinococcus enclensis]|uniref:Uncharacterized protein n=1 Tax=Deinococcus enclensis TaxID=1049582 RepID=A0ABT9MJS6_9DEIO|nr:hypothetical protein [Deinococcus enclensis]MDP9766469.1 hypothetical protein [Deinococcus enclensis]